MTESTVEPVVSIDIRRSLEPSHAVVEAVSAAEGINPLDLETPLYEAVEPDALDALFREGSTVTNLRFDYHGYEVEVSGEGSVSVCEHEGHEPSDRE